MYEYTYNNNNSQLRKSVFNSFYTCFVHKGLIARSRVLNAGWRDCAKMARSVFLKAPAHRRNSLLFNCFI